MRKYSHPTAFIIRTYGVNPGIIGFVCIRDA